MKSVLKIAVIANIIIFIFQAGCISKNENINSNYIIHEKSINDFFNDGYIENIVKLESNDKSLFGYVNQVLCMPDGDIYIADKYSTKCIYKYSENGKFIACYGKIGQGPGEYEDLISFTIGNDGQVYLLSGRKIINYLKNGNIVNEINIDYFGGDIVYYNNKIYVRSFMLNRNYYDSDKLIKVYDSNLKFINGYYESDSRIAKYRFIPGKNTIISGENLVYIDVYDLAFHIINLKTMKKEKNIFLSNNYLLDKVWKCDPLSEDNKNEIKRNIHRFDKIYSQGPIICLIEIIQNKHKAYIVFTNYKKKIINKYPLFDIEGNVIIDKKEPIKIDYLAGAYNDGLIFAIDDKNKLDRIKISYPQYKDLIYNENDNPLLIFYKMKTGI